MGSIKGNGRNQGSIRHRTEKARRRRSFLRLESLEERTLLTSGTTTVVPLWHATNDNLSDVKNGPMANEGQTLIQVYQDDMNAGYTTAQIEAHFPELEFSGNLVGISVNGTGDFNTFVSSLTNLGMQVVATSSTYEIVDGLVPISALPSIATLPQTLDATPNYKPQTSVFQGVADNEGQQALKADVAATEFNVTGAGVTVGVLSDSVSQTEGGLADSYATGDLSASNPVKVIQDRYPYGATDEGRAMLENIHDIAPGANLQFATADGAVQGGASDLVFANNITALVNAGSNLISDDVRYFDEPMFQNGLIAQAATAAVNDNVTYFSAAGNMDNQGYLSNFRPVAASVGTLGQGTYMNFNPGSGAPVTELPITVTGTAFAGPALLFMNFDQPFATQEPAGSTAAPTSEVDMYVLDAAGNVVAVSNNNNIATREPLQALQIPNDGQYFVVFQVSQGTAPNHIEFVEDNESTTVTVSQQFGTGPSAGGTYYPTSYGHATAPAVIGVGATPWWAPAPYLNQTPLESEPFSSYGPSIQVFNADGTPITTSGAGVLEQTPVVTGPDGGNTSFFPEPAAQNIIDTSNPPFPGEPATTTNLSQPNLPSFFGTSSATPNVEAVAALMLQEVPSLTPAEIRSSLIASTEPMDGAAAGTWNVEAGYGLVNAVAALSAADVLRVTATSPTNGQTVTLSPNGITVTFNKPVVFSTVRAADLTFTNTPAGVTATVGTPIAVDNPTDPTIITFPFSLSTNSPTLLANGKYSFTIQSPAGGPIVTSEDGKQLAAFQSTFTLNDTTQPVITDATVNARIVSVTFSKAMNPATINLKTIYLAYLSASGALVDLNNIPGVTISYNTTTDTATLDYSTLSQTQMPSGTYFLNVLGENLLNGLPQAGGVTDLVGNFLNGTFEGVFPSGNGQSVIKDPNNPGKFLIQIPNPSNPSVPITESTGNENFQEQIGPVQVSAPVITSLQLTPASDSGIPGDENTNDNHPMFIGQVAASFPGTVSGLTVYIEFNALHGGIINLATGLGGRGTVGTYDVTATTDANGTFTFQAPFLPEGYNQLEAVVVGLPDSPPLPGLSSAYSTAVRIDLTSPSIVSATLTPEAVTPGIVTLPLSGTDLPSLTTLSLDVVDPNNPTTGPLSVPPSVIFDALDPGTADNISNYSLFLLNSSGVAIQDFSSFITGATFTPTASDFFTTPPTRTLASSPNSGRVDLTFAAGLPAGTYELVAHTSETQTVPNAAGTATVSTKYQGLLDAAGNPLNDALVTGTPDYAISFNIQPEPVYITSVTTNVTNAQGNFLMPRSYYEINPRAGDIVSAPPTQFIVDVSNPLALTNPTTGEPIDFDNSIELIGSANAAGAAPDGDFGNLGIAGVTGADSPGASGFTQIQGTTVTLYDPPAAGQSGLGIAQGQPGFNPNTATRLVLSLAPGTTLPDDHYRFYMPNTGDSTLYDIYGNQLDGEFLGNPTANSSLAGTAATYTYEDFLPNGTERAGMSGDGVAGGAFMTGFIVVPSGNLIYARPDYVENPLEPSTLSNGSIFQPYPDLAPQATATAANGGNLNATVNFFSFNEQYDRAGSGHFDQSAIYAAQVLSANGPVVIVALPGTPQRNPITGVVTQPAFVLQAPAGSDPVINNGSTSVPFDSTLVFNASTIVKLANASIFAQNQGSSIEVLGGSTASTMVDFTSYKNDAIGGDTNHDGTNTTPVGGDWGGIVFRNFDEQGTATINSTGRGVAGGGASGATNTTTVSRLDNTNFPAFPVDGVLQGPDGAPAISGADDDLDFINYASLSYGGGAVPATDGFRYDSITAMASRPFISNSIINGGGKSSQATISGDLDSFLENDDSPGLTVRSTIVENASLNGIWIRPDTTGVVEATDAIPSGGALGAVTTGGSGTGGSGNGGPGNSASTTNNGPGSIPDNPISMGGVRNYNLDSPLPYILTSVMDIGQRLELGTGGVLIPVMNRLYIDPGMMIKMEEGAGIQVVTPGSSLIVGDRTYISGYDADASIDPTTGLPTSSYSPLLANGTPNPNFQPDSPNDADVVFTSALDNAATTTYFDQATQTTRTIVPPIDVLNTGGVGQPVAGSVQSFQRWGSVTISSGAEAVINDADFYFGGGQLNVPGGTTQRNALTLNGSDSTTNFTVNPPTPPLTPGGVPTLPNVPDTFTMTAGMGSRVMVTNNNFFDNESAPIGADPNAFLAADPLTPLSSGDPFIHGNVFVGNDLNGVLVLAPTALPANAFNLSNNSVWTGTDFTYILEGTIDPETDPNALQTFLTTNFPGLTTPPTPQLTPWITLTIQSTLPGTLLADGSTVAKPGVPVVVKLSGSGAGIGDGVKGSTNADSAGAGFDFGVDDLLDPPGDPLIDQGADSQLRILGIGGDQTTGQQRVPAIITSIHDATVGTTVRGVTMDQVITGDTTAPAPGDGGIIDFGGNTLTTYNALDIREGSKIDNANISYVTRIELQGGGFQTQDQAPENIGQELTISDSNLSSFLQDGVLAEEFPPLIDSPVRTAFVGSSDLLFMVNDTIANMPTGVRIDGQPLASPFYDPTEFIALNDTFYNDTIGVDLEAIYGTAPGQVNFAGMDNIFANDSTAAVTGEGAYGGSIMEYNLFFNDGADDPDGVQNFGAISGNPEFVDPAAGNFQLQANSAAIDAGRSEMNLTNTTSGSTFVTLVPVVAQVLTAEGGTFNGTLRPTSGPIYGAGADTSNVLTLPGYSERGYDDEWEAVLPTSTTAIAGPASNAATFDYMPITGQRDELGYLRVDDPNVPNVGFGSNPFYDVGAYEYVGFEVNPPTVTGVTATLTNPTTGVTTTGNSFYTVGGVAGTNQALDSIQVQFDHNLDPSTINSNTVELEESGGDGIFGNNNSPSDKFINLSGKLSFNSATNVLTINLGSDGLTLGSDEYRLILVGEGSNVLADPQGNALDGINTLNDDPNNPQLALPSGNGYPGTNFFTTFILNTQAPSVVVNPTTGLSTFELAPASDTNLVGDDITDDDLPSFTGTISVLQPAIDPLAGQTIFIQVSNNNGQTFATVGQGLTNANGTFNVQVNTALPNSNYNVGSDGLLDSQLNSLLDGTAPYTVTGQTIARVVIEDQSGNFSEPLTAPLSAFPAADVTQFIVDTTAPEVTAITPTPGTLLTPNASGGLTFTVTVNKNVDPATVNSSSIQVFQQDVNGNFTVNVPLSGLPVITPLADGAGGPETITFSVGSGFVTGPLEVVLKGTGSLPITDIAGNALDGTDSGTAGSDYVQTYFISNPGAASLIYVGVIATPNALDPLGSIENPYPTIMGALTAATTVAGDTVGVLPGIYNENVILKSLVKLVSADPTSTDTNLVPGNAKDTIIRPLSAAAGAAENPPVVVPEFSVEAINAVSFGSLVTEISGFTIAFPLVGNAATGSVDPNSIGVLLDNSNVLVDRDYIIDTNLGIYADETGTNPNMPTIEDDVIAGNNYGIFVDGSDPSLAINTASEVQVVNNTIAFNTYGMTVQVNASPPVLVNGVNNIFFENHDLAQTMGTGVAASQPNAITLENNLFSANSATPSNPSTQAFNVGNGFNPSILGPTPDAEGNFIGNPSFVNPRDPRSGSDGEADFILEGDFDLTSASAAINGANKAAAPSTDLLHRSPSKTGPSIGAFYFNGTGGQAVGGTFQVATDSLSPSGQALASGATVNSQTITTAPVVVTFTGDIAQSSVTANDLVITGNGVNPYNPVHASSLEWVDGDTVEFFLAGGVQSSGTLNFTIPAGTIQSVAGATLPAFSDSVKLTTTTSTPTPTPSPTPSPTPTPTPTPAPSPTPNPTPPTVVSTKASRAAALKAKEEALAAAKRAKAAALAAAKRAHALLLAEQKAARLAAQHAAKTGKKK